jgi:lysozyme family protein
MVRAGVVDHPSQWNFGGYKEIQSPRRKYVLIAYEKLATLAGYQTYDSFRESHKKSVNQFLAEGNNVRDNQWTRSIAVGEEQFVEKVKADLGSRAVGRRIRPVPGGYELREEVVSYNAVFDPKKSDIGPKNSYKWIAFP